MKCSTERISNILHYQICIITNLSSKVTQREKARLIYKFDFSISVHIDVGARARVRVV